MYYVACTTLRWKKRPKIQFSVWGHSTAEIKQRSAVLDVSGSKNWRAIHTPSKTKKAYYPKINKPFWWMLRSRIWGSLLAIYFTYPLTLVIFHSQTHWTVNWILEVKYKICFRIIPVQRSSLLKNKQLPKVKISTRKIYWLTNFVNMYSRQDDVVHTKDAQQGYKKKPNQMHIIWKLIWRPTFRMLNLSRDQWCHLYCWNC